MTSIKNSGEAQYELLPVEAEKTEEEIIREIAEEEGLTVEEVTEMWETFKKTAEERKEMLRKANATKPKVNKKKIKAKQKMAKKSKRRNR